MARKSTQPDPPNAGFGRLVILILFLCLGAVLAYRYYADKRSGEGNYTRTPKEVPINYLPADYEMTIDEERALEILSNPQRNRADFNELVYDINISILQHVANRLGLNEEQKDEVRRQYERHHPYLRNLYYQDFIALKDTTSNIYQTWYENESANATALLREVASKYTCFMVNHIFTTILPTEEGAILAKGMDVETPCGVALTEALQPMIKRMEERAAIRDFSRSRNLLQEKVERVIAELATMEVQDKKGLTKTLQTKLWGYSVSSTDLEITAISILKVGFRIHDYFDINLNSRGKVVTVTMPEPVILSHEVYPKMEKMDIGWLREIKENDLNRAFNALRAEFRREALESDVMEKAKSQAVELMSTMLAPLLTTLGSDYQLKVEFRPAEGAGMEPEIQAEDFRQ